MLLFGYGFFSELSNKEDVCMIKLMKFVLKNARIGGLASTNGPRECAGSQVTETLKKNKKTLNGDICCLDALSQA